MRAPWVTAIAIRHILRAARCVGVDVDDVVRRLRLPDSPHFEDHISITRVADLWEAILRRTPDAGLPARAAAIEERDEHSLLAMYAAAQPSLRDAFEAVVLYSATITDAHQWTMEVGHGVCTLAAEVGGPLHRAGWRCHLEFELIDIVHSVVRATDGGVRPERVVFAHRSPKAIDAHTEVLGVRPRWSGARQEIVYPAGALATPLRSAKPALVRLIKQQLDGQLECARAARPVTRQAALVLPELLRAGRISSADTAHRLGLSERTLERRLADEKTTFREVLDDVRFRLAVEWLRQTPLGEVAWRLGYSDVRAFCRAFKRWSGSTPTAFSDAGRSRDA